MSYTRNHLTIRMPDGMRDHIRKLAESNRRSMNSEIIVRLEMAFTEKTKTAEGDQPASKTPTAVRT